MGDLLNYGWTFDGFTTHNSRPWAKAQKGLAKGHKGLGWRQKSPWPKAQKVLRNVIIIWKDLFLPFSLFILRGIKLIHRISLFLFKELKILNGVRFLCFQYFVLLFLLQSYQLVARRKASHSSCFNNNLWWHYLANTLNVPLRSTAVHKWKVRVLQHGQLPFFHHIADKPICAFYFIANDLWTTAHLIYVIGGKKNKKNESLFLISLQQG